METGTFGHSKLRTAKLKNEVKMKSRMLLLAIVCLTFTPVSAEDNCTNSEADVPSDIKAIFDKPFYQKGIWGLRVVDLQTGEAIMDLRPNCRFFIGSVRKNFIVGELLNEIGPAHRYNTPVYRQGDVDRTGTLRGNLMLVASGDLMMGGRNNPDGSIAYSTFDHNEANSLGNAILTRPDPLAGYRALAHEVAQSGITEVIGDVVVDDRLFPPFDFREEFKVRPIFVNDDVVDVSITPGTIGELATVDVRPVSAALQVNNFLRTSNSNNTLHLVPEFPQCIGMPGCSAEVGGEIPVSFVPPLTGEFPLVQTFRIVEPSNYARTVFIEALGSEGVKVLAPVVAENPRQLLPPRGSYRAQNKVAELIGSPYSDSAKLILKVSYNIGADTSLVLFGLTQGINNPTDALELERRTLSSRYSIAEDTFHFVDGSGRGETIATNTAVTQMLVAMNRSPSFAAFFDALPLLGVDGSLGTVTDFEADPTLAGAKGQVRAKTGTVVEPTERGYVLKGQAFAGYIDTKRQRRLAYELVVNNVPITGINDVVQVFQDEGMISAILWRDH
jgi:D-alanyl-D-alanine carboxypeptidase